MATLALHLPCSSTTISKRPKTTRPVLCCSVKVNSQSQQGSSIQKQRKCSDVKEMKQRECREADDVKEMLLMSFMGFSGQLLLIPPDIAMAAEDAGTGGYSLASYYTSLGLFVLALPGVWSLIKRSAKSKIVRKTYLIPGPGDENGKAPKQIAGEISSFFTRNSFSLVDSGEVVRFEGNMVPSRGQAAFLIFCTFLSLASLALVLTITVPAVGDKWYWLTGLSPLAGAYYWTKAARKEEIQVKLVVADDETSTEVVVQGDDEQIELLRRELGLMEKGMVYVKGILQD